jgi:stage V sporulation protein D (sporulation-specific penicillin-binding protein)
MLNYPVEEAQKYLIDTGFIVQTSGEGNIVSNQSPQGGMTVASGSIVVLEVQPYDFGAAEEVTVPDFTGLSIKVAGSVLEKLGLYLNPAGSGYGAGQQEKPGTKVRRGTTITVEFQPPTIKPLLD